MITKGIIALVLAGLGVFAVSAGADTVTGRDQSAQTCPDMGLAALLRPMQH